MDNLFEFKEINGFIYLTKYLGNDEVVVIPKTYNGKAVIVIGSYCLYNYRERGLDKIKQIEIPDTVRMIERFAFYHLNNLVKINMPKYLQIIRQYSFSYCIN